MKKEFSAGLDDVFAPSFQEESTPKKGKKPTPVKQEKEEKFVQLCAFIPENLNIRLGVYAIKNSLKKRDIIAQVLDEYLTEKGY